MDINHSLSFYAIVSPSMDECAYQYYYRYAENAIANVDISINPDTGNSTISNISTFCSPHYSYFGFTHLATKLFIDMLADLRYRCQFTISKISGWLSPADNKRGLWICSIPFYIDLRELLGN